MGVMMQAFYWDCPGVENRHFGWWPHVTGRIPELAAAGVTALWLPPVSKGADARSMGYDPYDYYDLGEFDQKGAVSTWFGSRADLNELIDTAHRHGMEVYADMVLNHNSGADGMQVNPLTGEPWWFQFDPKSGKFSRNADHFHPSLYETMEEVYTTENPVGRMPDLVHRHPHVYKEILAYSRWLIEDVGFDGFRYDFVKGYGTWMIRSMQEFRYSKRGHAPFTYKPFGVAECWDSNRLIEEWLADANAWSDNLVSAFDFPLRDRLKKLCDDPAFSLSELAEPGTLVADQPFRAVTFVDNHDLLRLGDLSKPGVVNDKILAYAFVLTHEGYPCLFWQDYFNFSLGAGPGGLADLAKIHESHAGGETDVLHAGRDLYIMQRKGHGNRPGLIFVLNNRRDVWGGAVVKTAWPNHHLVPAAWRGFDPGAPQPERTNDEGMADVWAPPRGYSIYLPARV